MSSLPTTVVQTLSPQVKPVAVQQLLEETIGREALLRQVINRLEQQYNCSLEELEARLDRGGGQEHPDWEDSIEWRNAIESLERTQLLRNILKWLIDLLAPLPAS